MNSIFFVIVTYRPDKKTLAQLKAVLPKGETKVIDNTNHNLGYGGGANVGMREAFESGAQWVIVMNQDLRLKKTAVKELTDILKKSGPAIVGPFAGKFDPRRWTTSVPATKMDYISGSCIAIHRDVVEKIGYFYEPYFLYYEEADLCIRAKRAGFALRWLPIKGIEHEETMSLGRGSFAHQYYLARNHLLFVERQAPPLVKLYEFLRLPKTKLEHIARRQWGALRGLLDYFIRRFGPL